MLIWGPAFLGVLWVLSEQPGVWRKYGCGLQKNSVPKSVPILIGGTPWYMAKVVLRL